MSTTQIQFVSPATVAKARAERLAAERAEALRPTRLAYTSQSEEFAVEPASVTPVTHVQTAERRMVVADARADRPAKSIRRPQVAKRAWRTKAEQFDPSKVSKTLNG